MSGFLGMPDENQTIPSTRALATASQYSIPSENIHSMPNGAKNTRDYIVRIFLGSRNHFSVSPTQKECITKLPSLIHRLLFSAW